MAFGINYLALYHELLGSPGLCVMLDLNNKDVPLTFILPRKGGGFIRIHTPPHRGRGQGEGPNKQMN